MKHAKTFRGSPATCEMDYTQEQVEFMLALDRFKRDHRRPYPTCCDVLEVIESLGYRKVLQGGSIDGQTEV